MRFRGMRVYPDLRDIWSAPTGTLTGAVVCGD